MADNLKLIEERIDIEIDPTGAPGSILAENHNGIEKEILRKTGKYTGSPFVAKKESTLFPSGTLSWNGNAMNNVSNFLITTSKLTSDLTDFGNLLSTMAIGDLIQFKDYSGRTVFLEFQSYVSSIDGSMNPIYEITVKGFAENLNYVYQVNESSVAVLSFIKKIVDLSLLVSKLERLTFPVPNVQNVIELDGENHFIEFQNNGQGFFDYFILGANYIGGQNHPLQFRNATDSPIVLKNMINSGTSIIGETPLFFPNGLNLILEPRETVQFCYNADNNRFDYVGASFEIEISDVNGLQDELDLKASKTYVDGLVVGLLDDRGNYDASTNLFPSTGGSGTSGAILKGDLWYISIAGTLGGQLVNIGDSIRALTDAPGQTSGNWDILESNIGYVPENTANKSTDVEADKTSNVKFSTVKSIYDWAVGKFQNILIAGTNIKNINGQSILGSGNLITTSEISVQNNAGVEQFKVSDLVRFRGVEFDASTKQINVSALSPYTAFVDPTLGNNTTAEMENSKKPFQSIDGVFARYTSDQPLSSFVRIYLVNAGTYAWTQKIWSISFEIYSDKAVTVDLSTSSVVGSIFHNTSTANYSTYFNFPLGTLYCNGSASINFNHERRTLLLNVKAIYWNANPQYGVILAFQYGVTIQNLSELSINSVLFSDISICKTPMNLSILNTLGANARILCKNGITVGVINMTGSVNNLFTDGETWNIGNVNGVLLFSYTHNNTIKINFNNSTITGGMKFENENGNLTFSGYIKSMVIIGVTGTTSARRSVLNLVNLTIEDLKSDGFYFYDSFATVNILNCYIYQSVGTYLIKSLGRTSTAVKFTLKVEKTVYRQLNSGTLIYLDNNNNLENINIGGFESNCVSISNIANTPSTFDLLSFKDKKKEIVIRSKIDLIDRVLSSTTTYIIDGTLTLLTGEYIEVPVGGLTISGYGFDVSLITKNVAGQSIFKSPVGGSGNFVTNNIQYNSGLGSVFNLLDSDGSHAIELNDVNFQSCASLGTLDHYRQFTGTTCGIYGCSDGITLEGVWNGFKLVNTNAFSFGASGTLIKKGTTTSFSNRLYLDLNLSLPTGAKICDFDESNFSSNKLLQIVNCLVKVNGVIDPTTTTATFPNISPFSTKAYFTNNIGIKNSFNEPYGLKTSNLSTYANDVDATAGGIQIGEVYIESITGYFKTRLT